MNIDLGGNITNKAIGQDVEREERLIFNKKMKKSLTVGLLRGLCCFGKGGGRGVVTSIFNISNAACQRGNKVDGVRRRITWTEEQEEIDKDWG